MAASPSISVAGLVAQIPDPAPDGRYAHLGPEQAQRIRRVASELGQNTPASTLGLVEMLVEPGQGDDVKARFALHLLAVWVTQPGREKARTEFTEALATQLQAHRPKGVLGYLIEQLQLAGTPAAAPALGRLLLDVDLCDAAARALAAIGQGAAEQLLSAWPRVQGPARVSILQKLAALAPPAAREAFHQALADRDPEAIAAAAWGLARLADPEALPQMLKASDTAEGWYRNQLTDACLTLAERLAAQGKTQPAAAIYAHLERTRTDPGEKHVRQAAQRGLAALQTSAAAKPADHPAAPETEEGFRPLFDGHSLAGWKTTPDTPKSWKVENGLLVLTGGSSHLFTEEKFRDFVLRFEWRPHRKGYNSGLFVRGRQIQIADGSAGMLFGSKKAPGVPHLHHPPGQWNTWEVTCQGTRLTLRVNGKAAWEIDDFRPADLPVGIEAEGHPIDFRNLRIKRLE